jgi:transposase-like protein
VTDVLPMAKKQRKSFTLEEKLDVIRRYEHTVDIVRVTGISESTLRTIRNQAEKIKESCKSVTRMTASKITQIRPPIMEKLERMLA